MVAINNNGLGLEFTYPITDGSSYVDYKVYDSTYQLFEGRAYPIPGTNYVYFNITDIIENHYNTDSIKNDSNLFTESRGYYDGMDFVYEVSIKTEFEQSYTSYVTDIGVVMYLDDNNQLDFTGNKLLQMKDNYTIAPNCFMKTNFFSFTNYINSGTYRQYTSYPTVYTNDIITPVYENRNFYYFKEITGTTNEAVSVIYDGREVVYHISDCVKNKGCLYWINRFGGWETLLITGKNEYSQDFTPVTFTQKQTRIVNGNIVNNTYNQSNTIISKDIKKRWVVNTNYILDTEWNWIESLYSSPAVYYQDFQSNVIHSVVVTDTTFKRQLFRGNGRTIPNYEINLEGSITYKRK